MRLAVHRVEAEDAQGTVSCFRQMRLVVDAGEDLRNGSGVGAHAASAHSWVH